MNSSNKNSDDDSIKPLRLAKRNLSITNSPSKLSNTSITNTPKNDEFVCRPIRLGSRNKSTENETVNDNITSKHKSFNLLNSAITNDNPNPQTPSGSKHNSYISNSPSSNKDTSPSHLSNRKSIQIKNLPIIHSPKSHDSSFNISKNDDMIFAVCLVDFHHVRGPEIQWWKSNYHPVFNEDHKLFKNLPFQALPDGSHLFEETFSNFNLVYDFNNKISLDELNDIEHFDSNPNNLKTLFGCSCVRQVKTLDLSVEERERHKDITRSIVQKAVVVITRKQPIFTKIKEKLSIITKSYFQQDNFDNVEILEHLFDNLNDEKLLLESKNNEQEEEFFVNLNIKQTILKFKSNFLIIFKALLLEKKILIYSNNNLELLTQFQNNLISLIPNLISNLDYSGCPLSDYTEIHSTLSKPHTLNTNDRQSMLRFFGLPLQIFNTKNNFWNPYLPLQQLDELKINSFMAGCSNLLFLNQANHFKINLIVNLDTNEVTFPIGKSDDLSLSWNDKKFINNLISNINKDDENFVGNDDYIRYQFEDYLSGLVSTTRFHQYTERFLSNPPGFDTKVNPEFGDLSLFGDAFIKSWKSTKNYYIWDKICDEFIFNFQDPKHIGVDLVDNQPYAITNMFNNWKNKLNQQQSDQVNESMHPQKFIPDDGFVVVGNDKTSSNTENLSPGVSDVVSPTQSITSDSTRKSAGWNWGFKKK
ncbi:hypothetical protein HYPBUDRAFT_110862 [Hyphopichia burtonii NRRL Y-1933]|uniref:UDENN domain-containing protein n=1 Tax=Hyphopichia burtonii NRRL Y-1933 TaxID=984485 RepID=A0A1E4RGM6_9ASCO|nr:hypothetical protein HYPBUDRAFT_110862 [Hyphopichia burtonii NRRL Y-1933]ODV66408.1 hypothetical protein HYPBUDRAFT_110862 [Hyphopichia burtonii NRRL Y-1933]